MLSWYSSKGKLKSTSGKKHRKNWRKTIVKYLSARENLSQKMNSLVYSKPGAGKTRFGLYHPGPVIVDPGEQGYMTILDYGEDVPIFRVDSQDDVEAIVYYPEDEIARFKEAQPKFKDYEVGTFIFENLNFVQEAFLGQGSKTDPETKQIITPAKGIMKLPHTRQHSNTPVMKDYNVLQRATKGFFKGVRNMPYHTVMTVHAGLYETEESPKGIGSRDNPVSEADKEYAGFPNMYGQMKYTAGGLADFFFYLERVVRGGKLRYLAHTAPHGKFESRSKIASRLPASIDWTDKNIFDIVQGHLTKALEGVQ
jgi:hypothetical protein